MITDIPGQNISNIVLILIEAGKACMLHSCYINTPLSWDPNNS